MTPYKIYKQKDPQKFCLRIGVPCYEGYILGDKLFMFLKATKENNNEDSLVDLLLLTENGIEVMESLGGDYSDLFYEIV
jgi:hypothetical protein